jgi:hypothetical protein
MRRYRRHLIAAAVLLALIGAYAAAGQNQYVTPAIASPVS